MSQMGSLAAEMGFGGMSAYRPIATEIADHFCGRHDSQTRAEYRGRCFGDEGRLILAYKHDAEHFAAAPDDFASLAH
jgi:hypothetical protein